MAGEVTTWVTIRGGVTLVPISVPIKAFQRSSFSLLPPMKIFKGSMSADPTMVAETINNGLVVTVAGERERPRRG